MKTKMILSAAVVLCSLALQAQVCPNAGGDKWLKEIKLKSQVSTYKALTPESTKRILEDLTKDLGEQRMAETLGRPALESLKLYSELELNQIHANYAAAAAAGAAAAVVEYVWDRFVGNGGSRERLIRPQDYFDLKINPTFSVPENSLASEYTGAGPIAATPAAAGAAAVGAVAYKAVEYSMKKVFGERSTDIRIQDSREFDLNRN